MKPKARGLAQHGGPPCLLEESELAGVILYVMEVPYPLTFRYLTGCPAVRTDGISSCCYIIKMYTTIRHELFHARKAWPGTLVDPCLISDKHYPFSSAIAVTDWFLLRVKCGRWREGPWILINMHLFSMICELHERGWGGGGLWGTGSALRKHVVMLLFSLLRIVHPIRTKQYLLVINIQYCRGSE